MLTQADKKLGFTRRTILSWINKGRIKAIKGLREYRIPESEIERLKRGE